jgi:acyl dehydratase
VAVDDALLEGLEREIGVEHQETLGLITAYRIAQYAAAVGEDNPLYLDPEYARSRGHADVVAPPNFAAAVITWSAGAPYDRLRDDGTEVDSHLPGVPASGVRVMGGGEEIEFVKPVVAGTELSRTTVLIDVLRREGKSGEMVLAHYSDSYRDQSGAVLVNSLRTVILR